MAAGCLVVGFAGDGGWEYADHTNGKWIPEDDLEAADGLAAAVIGLRSATPKPSARIEAGKTIAAGYGPERQRAALVALFEQLQPSDRSILPIRRRQSFPTCSPGALILDDRTGHARPQPERLRYVG